MTEPSADLKSLMGALNGQAGEIQDNRFFVVSEKLYSMTGYYGCGDLEDHVVIEVYDVLGCYNESHVNALKERVFIGALVFAGNDCEQQARARMMQILGESLARFE